MSTDAPSNNLSATAREALDGLANRVHGEAIVPGDSGYEAGRAVWNAMTDRCPALVLRPSGAADVAAAVEVARDHGLPLSIRGGGHNVAGLAACDHGIMLNMENLCGVRVDPSSGRARVGPGAVWADVDRETQAHGLAVPSGLISATGVAGLTLGGGFGWTARALGLTCDRLRSADVVTAGGDAVKASADEHPDLFWGLRGGGGNFGVVTSFEFEPVPIGPTVFAGMCWYPYERVDEVIANFRDLTADAPRELGSLLVLRKAPPAPFLPESFHGRLAAGIAVCFIGADEDAERAVEPLRRLSDPIADTLGPKEYRSFQQVLDAGQPHGRRYYWKTHYFNEWPKVAESALAEGGAALESPHSAILCMHLGGAISDVPDADSAVANRDARYVLNIQGAWEAPDEDQDHIGWVRETWRALEPWGAGQYVNFITADAAEDGLEKVYGRERFGRLREIKTAWDPDNVFRMNHNIPPA